MTKPVEAARRLSPIVLALLLGGCATNALKAQHDYLEEFGKTRLGLVPAWLTTESARNEALTQVDKLLEQPLSQEAAVRIALTYSPAYQTLLAEQVAESTNITQSARVANPVFAFERLVSGNELEINRSLTVSLLQLLTLPRAMAMADVRQHQLQLQAASSLLQTVIDVRQAWVEAVAAEQASVYFKQVRDAAEAGADLAKRMQAAGNFSRLQQARQQAFLADAQAQLTHAKRAAVTARESLTRKLGLGERQQKNLKLPDQLPDLPESPMSREEAMQTALEDRLDVQLAKSKLDYMAKSQGLTRVTSYVNGLHLKGEHNSLSGQPVQKGYEVEMPLPLFDWGDARREGAKARYLAALNRTAQVGVDASSYTRQAYADYAAAYDLAKQYRDEIVPLRRTIANEMLLRYNGMLSGVFELLTDAREQVGSVIGALSAQRDFWLADAALHATLLGQPMTTGQSMTSVTTMTSSAGSSTDH